jgi:hypothetical protein
VAVDGRVEECTGAAKAVAACDDSGGRCAGSLSKADLDRGFALRRSAMDYAIGRQAGGGSDGRRRGWEHDSLMDRVLRVGMAVA